MGWILPRKVHGSVLWPAIYPHRFERTERRHRCIEIQHPRGTVCRTSNQGFTDPKGLRRPALIHRTRQHVVAGKCCSILGQTVPWSLDCTVMVRLGWKFRSNCIYIYIRSDSPRRLSCDDARELDREHLFRVTIESLVTEKMFPGLRVRYYRVQGNVNSVE